MVVLHLLPLGCRGGRLTFILLTPVIGILSHPVQNAAGNKCAIVLKNTYKSDTSYTVIQLAKKHFYYNLEGTHKVYCKIAAKNNR